MMKNEHIRLHWNWDGPEEMIDYTCKACSVRKAKQLAINKHMDVSKKSTRAGKRIFLDLATMKAPQDSGIIITNKNWHIVVDQYTGYKE